MCCSPVYLNSNKKPSRSLCFCSLPLLNPPVQYKHHLSIPAIILTLPFNGSKMKSSLLFTDALKLRRPNAFNVMLKPAGPSCNLNCTYCYYLEKSRLYPHSANLKMSDKSIFLQLSESLVQLFFCIHDNRPTPGNRFFERHT